MSVGIEVATKLTGSALQWVLYNYCFPMSRSASCFKTLYNSRLQSFSMHSLLPSFVHTRGGFGSSRIGLGTSMFSGGTEKMTHPNISLVWVVALCAQREASCVRDY